MSDVDAGFFLKGPFTADQISEMLQSDDWSLSKRFALCSLQLVDIALYPRALCKTA